MAVIDAEEFELSTSESSQKRLDGDAVKALLEELKLKKLITQDDIDGCYKTININTVRTNRKDKSKAPEFKVPDLSNATPVGVADMLGVTREQKKDLEKLEGIYKGWLESNYFKPLEEKAKAAAAAEGGAKQLEGIDADGIPDWAKKAQL
jgi:hypothetical protein